MKIMMVVLCFHCVLTIPMVCVNVVGAIRMGVRHACPLPWFYRPLAPMSNGRLVD